MGERSKCPNVNKLHELIFQKKPKSLILNRLISGHIQIIIGFEPTTLGIYLTISQ